MMALLDPHTGAIAAGVLTGCVALTFVAALILLSERRPRP